MCNILSKLTGVLLAAIIFCMIFSETGLSAEALSINEIVVTNNLGEPQTEFSPKNILKITVLFQLAKPSVAILRGKVSGENWSTILQPKFKAGRAGDYETTWSVNIPATAVGHAQVEVICLNPFRERVIRSAFFTVVSYDAEYIGSTACSLCHQAIYSLWQKTLHAPLVGCEVCHGPGSEHVLTQSAQLIKIDTSATQCGFCHSRNDGTIIEATNGFIKNQQQYNEFSATNHGRILECVTCHNPHVSVSIEKNLAIKRTCSDCHNSQRVDLFMEDIDCTECHMPFAVLRAQSTGVGLYKKGDQRTHVVRIKTEANPQEMFTAAGNALRKDVKGAFITDNFSCLGCHNGIEARLEDFESVRQTSTLIHY